MAKFEKPGVVEELTTATVTATTGSTSTLITGTTTADVIKVAAVYVSASAAMTVDFSSPSTSLHWRANMGAGDGQQFVAPPDEFLFITATSDALTVTGSTNGNLFVSTLFQRST